MVLLNLPSECVAFLLSFLLEILSLVVFVRSSFSIFLGFQISIFLGYCLDLSILALGGNLLFFRLRCRTATSCILFSLFNCFPSLILLNLIIFLCFHRFIKNFCYLELCQFELMTQVKASGFSNLLCLNFITQFRHQNSFMMKMHLICLVIFNQTKIGNLKLIYLVIILFKNLDNLFHLKVYCPIFDFFPYSFIFIN